MQFKSSGQEVIHINLKGTKAFCTCGKIYKDMKDVTTRIEKVMQEIEEGTNYGKMLNLFR